MNNLKDIHNIDAGELKEVLLFYQDFNEQFEGYTQRMRLSQSNSKVVLSGFQ